MLNDYKRVPVPGFEGLYEVDTNGDVFSLRKNKKMAPTKTNVGYYEIHLYKDGKRTVKTIHRLVAETFIPNPERLPQINHKDETRTNNAVSNLEWCDQKYNLNYGTVNERMSRSQKGRIQSKEKSLRHSDFMKRYRRLNSKILFECINDGHVFITYKDAADEYGLDRHDISDVCRGIRPSVKGYLFRSLKS